MSDNHEDVRRKLEDAHRLYKERVRQEKDAVYDRLEFARYDLSLTMHEAHDAGLSKNEIRKIVRAYWNNDVFLPLWNAYTPEEPEF